MPGWGGGCARPRSVSGVKRLAGGISLAANVLGCRGASSLAGLVDLLVLLVAGGHLGERGLGLLVGYLGSCRCEVPVTLGGETESQFDGWKKPFAWIKPPWLKARKNKKKAGGVNPTAQKAKR